MVNNLEEPPKTYTSKDIEKALHDGYQIAEKQYSLQIIKLKARIKELNG